MPGLIIEALAVYLGTAAATIITYAVIITASLVISNQQRVSMNRKARESWNASLEDRTLTIRGTTEGRRIVLGRCRVGGVLQYVATTGTHKEQLAMVIALAAHEIDAVESIYFNDEEVTLDGSGYVTTTPYYSAPVLSAQDLPTPGTSSKTLTYTAITGSVSVVSVSGWGTDTVYSAPASHMIGNACVLDSGTYGSGDYINYQYLQTGASSNSKARVLIHLGTAAQTVDTVLNALLPTEWDSTHKGTSIAYLVCLFTYDQDAFPSGLPNVSAVIRGAKCFDPRNSTTAWSENPAICARHYALSDLGGRLVSANINDTQIAAAANVCDTSVTYIEGGVSTTRALYKCGLMADTKAQAIDVLNDLAQAMAGRIAFAGNKLIVRAGSYVAPLLTLSDGDFAIATREGEEQGTPIFIQPNTTREQLFNVVTGRFSDPLQGYKTVDMPRVAATAYITQDGAELPVDIQFNAIAAVGQCQQVSGVLMRQARQGLTIVATFKLTAYAVELFDNVTIVCERYGWTGAGKVFEVLGRKWSLDGGIELTLRETAASVYAFGGTFDKVDAAPNTLLPSPWIVPAVTGLACASGTSWLMRQSDGTIVPRLHVSWSAQTEAAVLSGGGVDVRYGLASDAEPEWTTISVSPSDTMIDIANVQEGAVYIVMARARNSLSAGKWCTNVQHQVVGKSALPSDVTGLASSNHNGIVRIAWTACADLDYDHTELRYGASWAAGALIGIIAGNQFSWLNAAAGLTYIYAKHIDTTGHYSTTEATISLTVSAAASGHAVTYSATAPTSPSNGDTWIDTSGYSPVVRVYDSGAWKLASTSSVPGLSLAEPFNAWSLAGDVLTTVSDGKVGTEVLRLSTDLYPEQTSYVSVDRSKVYRMRFWARPATATGTLYCCARQYTSPGNPISNGNTGYGLYRPGVTVATHNATFGTGVWGEYSDIIVSADWDATTKATRPAFFQYIGSGYWEVQAFAFDDVTESYAASLDAEAAVTSLARIAADGWLAKEEKPDLVLEWLEIDGEKGTFVTQVTSFSGTGWSQYTTYIAAYNALNSYLSGLSPAYTDTTQDTVVSGPTFGVKFTDYYTARQALINKMSDYASTVAAWGGVSSRPVLYRVASTGFSASGNPIGAGLYNGETGATLLTWGYMYRVAKIKRDTGEVTDLGTFNTNAGTQTVYDLMATALNSITSSYLAVVFTNDQPKVNTAYCSNLLPAMLRCGASRGVWYSPQFQSRGAFILIGIGGCGEGNGFESYQGAYTSDPGAWCDVGFFIQNSNLVISGMGAIPRTLADYSYSGDLAATKNIVTYSAIDPGGSNGDIWVDTSVSPNLTKVRSGGTWYVGANYSTNTNQLTDGADLGLTSLWTRVSGTGKPSDYANSGSMGGCVNSDPFLANQAEWTYTGSAPSYSANFDNVEGMHNALYRTTVGQTEIFSKSFPISPSKTYLMEASVYKYVGSTAKHYLLVVFYDASGTVLHGSGWPSSSTYDYWGIVNLVPAANYTNTYTIVFGASQGPTIPSGAVSAKVGILANYGGLGTGGWGYGGCRVRDMADTQMIANEAATAVRKYIATTPIVGPIFISTAMTHYFARAGLYEVTVAYALECTAYTTNTFDYVTGYVSGAAANFSVVGSMWAYKDIYRVGQMDPISIHFTVDITTFASQYLQVGINLSSGSVVRCTDLVLIVTEIKR